MKTALLALAAFVPVQSVQIPLPPALEAQCQAEGGCELVTAAYLRNLVNKAWQEGAKSKMCGRDT